MTVFKEHLAHDECSGGKVSSAPTPLTSAIHSRDTQTHPETTYKEEHTGEARHEWKTDRERLRAEDNTGHPPGHSHPLHGVGNEPQHSRTL